MNELKFLSSRHFAPWLAEHNISLAFSTYQAGKLFMVGRKPECTLGVFERTFNRCMGLWTDGQTLWAGTAFQLWRFENVLENPEDGFDRLFVPRQGITTGDIDVHDLAFSDGKLHFISTLFSVLAQPSERDSFKPLWLPPFVTRMVPEDRCHLNGLAMVDGKPRFVTATAQTDMADAWRDQRADGGCVIDVETNEVITGGLSMPHSPRWHNGKLWLLNSGSGQLGYIEDNEFIEVAFLPGYARGLAFQGNQAIVGVSRPRHEPTFSGLPLEDKLARRNAKPQCGLFVVDLENGHIAHWMKLEGKVDELYDVVVLPQVERPKLLGFKTDEIRYTVKSEGNPTIWRGSPKG